MALGLPANLRALRAALAPLRQRGFGKAQALLWQLPAAVLLRAWRALAQPCNALLLGGIATRRLARFQQRLPQDDRPRLYVIVMPHTLHFLHPCLSLVAGGAQLVLLANGAKGWERRWLAQRFPALPLFVLPTLPLSSAPHGAVISLLLRTEGASFGILDHDAYVFDAGLLLRLLPTGRDSMTSCFEARSERTGLAYPLTHLLFLNAPVLRELMQRWRIDARLYRRAPASVAQHFARLDLGPRSWLKPFQGFFDTLHVLLIVAQAEGWTPRFEVADPAAPVWHVGGTSIGSHHTKPLFALWLHLRFLELVGDETLSRRYAFIAAPLRHSDEALQRRAPGDAGWQGLEVALALFERLQQRLHPVAPIS
jgi:hypothetical protein